ncbi:hypothetical protein BBK36DRAFT_1131408 [Trichoderma citrinoviride]|uniref:2EXR domain-containing protein n=1 Tax=Trichoderma citrinoviride TaxID=58853 RepID=A0A2T4AWW7_9HYPO|nr:hypothetical protein BBK36DRAFT_1131408 [Trichoderma citrinoviride]PTB61560.1 hypothetical protein BBK36DRAFT_1131408 [Trichoderma citrinoviride]
MAVRPSPSRCRASSRQSRSSTAAKGRTIDKGPSPKPDSFRSFARLPAELRLKIWAASLPGPRLVSIQCGSNISSVTKPSPSIANAGCTSPAPIPASLHACAESRAEALKTYRPSFGFFRAPGHVLFNPDVDIMYFGPREGFMAADSQFHTCMTLCDPAVNDALFWTGPSYNSLTAASFTLELLRQIAMRMTGLRELIFVPWEDELVVDEAVVHERMARQIQTAMQSVTRLCPSWQPPPWRIVPLNQLPSPTG